MSFASTLFTVPISEILAASHNYNIVGLWTIDGRDNVANFSGGTVLLSNGIGWKSFDITDGFKESMATSPISINYAFNYTGDSGFTFSSAEGGAPAFIRITTEEITTAVPEPETYAMLLAGLGLMGAVARRSKAKHA